MFFLKLGRSVEGFIYFKAVEISDICFCNCIKNNEIAIDWPDRDF